MTHRIEHLFYVSMVGSDLQPVGSVLPSSGTPDIGPVGCRPSVGGHWRWIGCRRHGRHRYHHQPTINITIAHCNHHPHHRQQPYKKTGPSSDLNVTSSLNKCLTLINDLHQ